ncbi:hypothetical protein BP00DRAFT_335139 [Aspergillus indologenus CBS 114.80]|uniref:Uncharacterized protein n=1 Tax=Aspergillus indologenus CBS 114.80 TaxID=1450541 RepID=A0A2V5IEL1_9EURO|nr:hypothetical protein BP00DRAFT_335139 [Aspergillus indologenus CBS 114.80]
MGSPGIDLDVAPNPRTKEENQERAFIAASRRKDRSLDARVESANRASSLHKQRTGKALLISRDIVEREAMYEEVDDRYQEKINRMLHAQSMQLHAEFNRNLMAAWHGARPGGGLHQRRAASAHMNPRASINGIRKMSLDLSGLRSSIAEDCRVQPGPMTSPLSANPSSYVLSPTLDGTAQSPSYPNVVPASAGQVPSYIAQAGGPTWSPVAHQQQQLGPRQPFRSPWTAGYLSPQLQQPTASLGEMAAMPVRQFRDRMASAPVIPVHTLATSPLMGTPAVGGTTTTAAATVTPPTPAMSRPVNVIQHNRVRSEPGQTVLAHGLPTTTTMSQMSSPRGSGQDMGSSAELIIPTPDLCPTPSTPHSPHSTGQNPGGVWGLDLNKEEGVEVTYQADDLDPEYDEFSRFAFGLGSGSQLPEADVGFDEFFTLEEYPISA